MASLRKARQRGDIDLKAWEDAILRAVFCYAANLLTDLLSDTGCGRRDTPVLDDEGQPMHSISTRPKTLTTLLGEVTIRRSIFRSATATQTRIPLDETLGVEGTTFSPGVRRMMARAGSRTSFADASEDLSIYARLDKTREAKLGCVFTQTHIDKDGRPVCDPDSNTYVAAIESSTLFGLRIHEEALRRGSDHAKQIVILTDGARYNKTIASTHFPGAVHIIDLYHAREHLAELATSLSLDQAQQTHWSVLLDMGRIEDLLFEAAARIEALSANATQTLELQKKLGYFRENADLMHYADFRLAGHFVGSGVVEAGCRTVIGQRLKHSGMFWGVRGANAILALRCCQFSDRFDDFWEEAA
jgi:hypothetical protein